MKVPRWAAGLQAGGRYTGSITERITGGPSKRVPVENNPQKPPKPPRLLSYSTGTAKNSRGFGFSKPPHFPPETYSSTRLYSRTQAPHTQKRPPSGENLTRAALGVCGVGRGVSGGRAFYSLGEHPFVERVFVEHLGGGVRA